MSAPIPSRTLAMLAGVLVLAAGAAEAQNRPAAKDDGKDVKSSHAATSKPVTDGQHGDKTASREDTDQSDMIMLQEPFRPGPATPVNVTRGR